MSDERLREAVRKVLDQLNDGDGVTEAAALELRAALDDEPEVSPSDEERARELMAGIFSPGDPTHDYFVKRIAAALAEARREKQ